MIFVFVKVASAVAVAVTTPFKDLAVVLLSDQFVVPADRADDVHRRL